MADGEIRIPAAGLTLMLTRVFRAAGGSHAEAEAIARNLVEANLAGHDSHGVIRTERYLAWQARGILNFGRSAETVIDGPGFALLDGHHGFGQTVGPQAVALGIARARLNGFAVIGLRKAGHLGRIGAFAETACAQGLVSIHFVNVGNSVLVAPFGGAARRMSTAPVAIGVPHEDGDFILDFATSKVAEGKVLVARKGRKPAPDGSLIGPDGQPTADTDALYGPAVEGVVRRPARRRGRAGADGRAQGVGAGAGLRAAGRGADRVGHRHRGRNRPQSQRHAVGLHRPEGARRRPRLGAFGRGLYRRHPRLPAGRGRGLGPGPRDPERRRRAERLRDGLPLAPDVWESLLRAGESKGLDRAELKRIAGV